MSFLRSRVFWQALADLNYWNWINIRWCFTCAIIFRSTTIWCWVAFKICATPFGKADVESKGAKVHMQKDKSSFFPRPRVLGFLDFLSYNCILVVCTLTWPNSFVIENTKCICFVQFNFCGPVERLIEFNSRNLI